MHYGPQQPSIHCSICSSALLHSFVRLFVHSLTSKLVGKVNNKMLGYRAVLNHSVLLIMVCDEMNDRSIDY